MALLYKQKFNMNLEAQFPNLYQRQLYLKIKFLHI